MNIEARKLELIEEFLRISDESIIDKLEVLMREESKKLYDSELTPMSVNEFHEMIDQAILDKENGRVISHEDLKKRVKSWK